MSRYLTFFLSTKRIIQKFAKKITTMYYLTPIHNTKIIPELCYEKLFCKIFVKKPSRFDDLINDTLV